MRVCVRSEEVPRFQSSCTDRLARRKKRNLLEIPEAKQLLER